MKQFRFQYQKILDLRTKEADNAKLVYGKAVKEVDSAKQTLEQYQSEELRLQREIATSKSMTPNDLQILYQYYLQVKKMRESQLRRVVELERYMQLKQKELVQAYREEKKWDKLSEILKDEYIFEQQKAEQRALDEISLQRYIMKSN